MMPGRTRSSPRRGGASIVGSGHRRASFPRARPCVGRSRLLSSVHPTDSSASLAVSRRVRDVGEPDRRGSRTHGDATAEALGGWRRRLRDWGSRRRERSLPAVAGAGDGSALRRKPGPRRRSAAAGGRPAAAWAGGRRRPPPGRSAGRGRPPGRRPPAAAPPGRPSRAGRTAGCSGRAGSAALSRSGAGLRRVEQRRRPGRAARRRSGTSPSAVAAAGPVGESAARPSAPGSARSRPRLERVARPGREHPPEARPPRGRRPARSASEAADGRPAELLLQQRRAGRRDQELDAREARLSRSSSCDVEAQRADDVDRDARRPGVGPEVGQRVDQPPVALDQVGVDEDQLDVGRLRRRRGSPRRRSARAPARSRAP